MYYLLQKDLPRGRRTRKKGTFVWANEWRRNELIESGHIDPDDSGSRHRPDPESASLQELINKNKKKKSADSKSKSSSSKE